MHKKRRIRKSRYPLPGSLPGSGLKQKKKSDWAGIGPADAFRPDLSYYVRIPAQRIAYKMFRKIQIKAAQLAGDFVKDEYNPMVKPQLAPCYSTYPSALSIHAAIGLTGFLEFQRRTAAGNLETVMTEFLSNPAALDQLEVHEESYKKWLISSVKKCKTAYSWRICPGTRPCEPSNSIAFSPPPSTT